KDICSVDKVRQQLYVIVCDPAETVNIYRDNAELAKTYYKSIQDIIGEPVKTTVTDLDPRVLEQLRSLGYVGDDEDPKKQE
ncbi:MAG: hypothetical protein QGD94_08145, partial [Planctomycetia bacterium]|nr:hypothetical protein [Planctomycetia bacterium]